MNDSSIKAGDFFWSSVYTDYLTWEQSQKVIAIMERFAMAKCKEQREICARLISGWPSEILTETEMADRIVNAQPPEL